MTGKVEFVHELLNRVEDILAEIEQSDRMDNDLAIVYELTDQIRDELETLLE